MKKVYFKPYIHRCKDHLHLITGPDFGASPPFVSMSAAKFLLQMAIDPKNKQDERDASRIQEELATLRVMRGKRNGKLPIRRTWWEDIAIPGWSSLLDGSLTARNMPTFLHFANNPCDFVCKTRTSDRGMALLAFSMRGRTVTEVQQIQQISE